MNGMFNICAAPEHKGLFYLHTLREVRGILRTNSDQWFLWWSIPWNTQEFEEELDGQPPIAVVMESRGRQCSGCDFSAFQRGREQAGRSCALCGAGDPSGLLFVSIRHWLGQCENEKFSERTWECRRISGNTDEAASENGLERKTKPKSCCRQCDYRRGLQRRGHDTDTSQNTGHCCHSCQKRTGHCPCFTASLAPSAGIQGRSIWLAESESSTSAFLPRSLGKQAFFWKHYGRWGCEGWGILRL